MTVRDELLAAIPSLRAFAFSLRGRDSRADDLVQETLVKALAHLDSFQPGTNMVAWLYTILRHEFYSEYRRRRHEVADEDGHLAARLAVRPTQDEHMRFLDFLAALNRLAPEAREALMLVGASGLSYEEAADLCRCPVGTMKSRVNRARSKLASLLPGPSGSLTEPDSTWSAAVDASWSGGRGTDGGR
jgi:RNA polymerase sigma-70 factor, ECF subfamily